MFIISTNLLCGTKLCSSFPYVYVLKHSCQSNLGRKKFIWLKHIDVIIYHSGGLGQTQVRPEAESKEECCLMAHSLASGQLAFL